MWTLGLIQSITKKQKQKNSFVVLSALHVCGKTKQPKITQ
jgi:uncharacterized protein YbaP (TraB family)